MIGIIGAMDIEVDGLVQMMSDVNVTEKAGMKFNAGKLHGKDIVVVKCGVGKVNAAIAAQIMIDTFGSDVVINSGVAGSLDNEVDICDIVLSTDAVQHDMDVTPLGYKKGQIPDVDTFAFAASEKYRELAMKVASCELTDIKVFCGRVASGDQFINGGEVKDGIIDNFSAMCAEMEGGAIAQVCYLNNVPFLIIRAISDKADGSSHMDYPVFEKKAAENSIKLLAKMIEGC